MECSHLDERDPRFQQAAGEQAVAAEVVGAVAVEVARRLLGHVKNVAALHELQGLFISGRVGFGLRRAATTGEAVVQVVAEHFAPGRARVAQRAGPRGVGRRVAIPQNERAVLGPEKRRLASRRPPPPG